MAHPEEERKALGRLLAAARGAAGYTLDTASAEFARRGHPISRGTIGAWETGRNLPDAVWLRRLAKLYENTLDALVGNTAPPARWRFSEELRQAVLVLSDEKLAQAESVLRSHLGMPPMRQEESHQVLERSVEVVQQRHTSDAHEPRRSGYPNSTVQRGSEQRRYSALEKAARFADDGRNDGAQDQRAPRQKRGGGA